MEVIRECLSQKRDQFVNMALVDYQRWADQDEIAVDTVSAALRIVYDEPQLKGSSPDVPGDVLVGREGLLCLAVAYDLNSPEQTAAPNVADLRQVT